MTPRLTPRILIAAVIVVACTDSPGPADVPTDTTSPGDSTFGLGVVTSNPIQDLNAGTSQLLSPQAVSEIDSGFVYASIFPGTAASGVWASVTSLGNQSQVWTQLRDGGFDPVAVRAAVGDTIDISARDGSGSVVYARRVAVAAVRRPVLRRIDPPPRKRDVPLNTSVVIVFSEPIDSADLARAVRLYRGNALVPGTVHLLQGNGERAAFTPTAPLARNTDYRLVIDPGIADRTGDQLETGATVTFATGTSTIGPPASMVVAPDTVFMTPGTYQLTATVFDSRGNVHVNAAVVWAAQPASNFTVSATGLVTALALGEFSVTATAGGVTSRVGIHVLGGPPATVEVWPQSPTVQMGDTIMLTVIQRIGPGGDVLFAWSAFDHLDITDLPAADRTGANVNWTHGNAIDLDPDGNLIASFRSLNEITRIDTRTGEVLWRLGGLRNQFTFIDTPLPAFARQHGVRMAAGGQLSLLDNVGNPAESRAERYALDAGTRTVRLVQSYGSVPGVRTDIGGSVQQLDAGRALVSFGTAGRVEEYDASDRVLWRIDGNAGYVFRAQRIHSLYQPGIGDPR